MKKLLLTLAAVLGFGMAASADTVTFDFAAQGYSNAEPLTEVKVNEYITLTFDKGPNNNGPKYYNTGAAVRLYGSNTMTVAGNGVEITEITFTTATGNEWNPASTASVGTFTVADNQWTGKTESVTFTQGGSSGHCRIKEISIIYASADPTAVATPVITVVEGDESSTVEITCDTEGAKIYYTLDKTEPTTASDLYTAPFEIWESCTIKAIAVDGEKTSNIATYEAKIPFIIYNIGELQSIDEEMIGEAGVDFELRGTVTAIYQNGNYTYVTSGYSYMLLYGTNLPTVKNGDIIENLKGNFYYYEGLPEVRSASYTVTAGTAADVIAPHDIEIEYVGVNQANFYILLKDVEISDLDGDIATITGKTEDGAKVELPLFNRFKIDVPEGKGFDVTGFVSVYKGKVQIYPTEIADGVVMEQVATPVIDPDGGELEAGATITITCETVGATIYYTTDGTEPTDESTEYTAPIAFAEAMTVKAIAVAEGMLDSDVVSASFTLHDPNAPQDFTAEFDFTDLASLTPAVDPADKDENNAINIEDKTFTSGKVSVRVTTEEGSKTSARFYESSGVWSLRGYAGTTITVSVPTGYALVTVEMTGSLSKIDNLTGGVWTATGSETSVEFTPTASTTIKTMTVNYKGTSGIADAAVDANAPVEYFNLQGVRVANPEGGLYIRRQGANVSKVIIR